MRVTSYLDGNRITKTSLLQAGAVSTALLFTPLTFAAMNANAGNHLSVAGGIAMPSYATAAFQNAAAMTTAPGMNISLQGGSDTGFSTPQGSGGLLYGNGSIGVGAGVTALSLASNTFTNAFYGLAIGFSGKASFGLSGSTGLSPSTDTAINAGLHFTPSNALTLGFTAMGLTGGNIEWGGGLAFGINPSAKLVVDVTADQSLSTINAQPGLWFGNNQAALTLSYGFGQGGSRQLSNGFAAGGSLMIKNSISWQVYYNQLAELYTAVTFRI